VRHQQADSSYDIISLAFPAPAHQFVAITKDRATGLNSVRAFEVVTGRQTWKVDQHRNPPWEMLRTSAAGKWCGFRVGIGGKTQFVEVAGGTPAFALPDNCMAMSGDGRQYAASSFEVRQWVLRRVDGSERPVLFRPDVQFVDDAMAFSPDGSYVGLGTMDGTVFLAEISAVRQRLATLRQ